MMINSIETPGTPFSIHRSTATAHDLPQLPLLPGRGCSARNCTQASLSELYPDSRRVIGPMQPEGIRTNGPVLCSH